MFYNMNMSITTIYFIQHLDPEKNKSKPLSIKGLKNRSLVTEYLCDKKINLIFSNPYKKIIETIKPFADSIKCDINISDAFQDNQPENQCFDEHLNIEQKKIYDKLQERNIAALQKIIKENRDKNIVIGIPRLALATILSYYNDSKLFANSTPLAVKMVFDDDQYQKHEYIDLFRHSESHNDITLKTENDMFYYSVRGIIKQSNKYLVMRVTKPDGSQSSFHFPGGHVEVGEEAEQTIRREILEEVGCEVKDVNLFAFIENFWKYNGMLGHGIELAFITTPLTPLKTEDYHKIEVDKNVEKKLEFKWLTTNELKNFDVRPAIIKDIIISGKTKIIQHVVQRP